MKVLDLINNNNKAAMGEGSKEVEIRHVAKGRETTYFLQKMVNLGDRGSGKQGRCFFVNTGQ